MKVKANGLEFEVEVTGDGRPLVLVMGLGAQLVCWPEDFVAGLAARGFRVIRFDNRDIGRSTWLSGDAPSLMQTLARGPWSRAKAYSLNDMADDVAGVLSALEIERAHVFGVSMGGMIAQCVALRHRDRVHSLTSMMSTPGGLGYFPTARALKAILKETPKDRDEALVHLVELFRVIGSEDYPIEEGSVRKMAGESFDRGIHRAGFARQFAAVWAAPNRKRALRQLEIPALVMHGAADRLVPPAAGRATAAALRTEVIEFPGMGHDLPRALWSQMFDAIEALSTSI